MIFPLVALGGWLLGARAAEAPADLTKALSDLKAVAPEGKGNAPASAAWRKLAAADGKALLPILRAMDGANDYALNWLRSAVETIAQREASAGRSLPLAELQSFLGNTKNHPRARRLAYELVATAAPERAREFLPSCLNDPSNELRRDAVQQLADTAAAKATVGDKAAAVAAYRQALTHARESDQIETLAKKLDELGEKVDLAKTFGWVTKWKVVGPFDNTGGAGFGRAFAPEEKLDFDAELDGTTGKVRWRDYETKSDYGLVDFNQPLTALKSVTGYAATEFWSDTGRTVQLRLGCKNGWKVWLNGEFLFGRDEYHRGMEIDQYRLTARLKPGRNVILVKCLQNEQTEDWTKEWEFQLRITDDLGTPIFSAQ